MDALLRRGLLKRAQNNQGVLHTGGRLGTPEDVPKALREEDRLGPRLLHCTGKRSTDARVSCSLLMSARMCGVPLLCGTSATSANAFRRCSSWLLSCLPAMSWPACQHHHQDPACSHKLHSSMCTGRGQTKLYHGRRCALHPADRP